jgi:phage RecT family recombinase
MPKNQENSMTPIQAFQDFLWSQEEKITKALPVHLTAKRFISSASAYIENAPKLMETDRNTLVQSIMKAAQMGLVIDGVESALVPRKAKCTLMVMFQGLLKMVRNSGELKDIQSAVVYEKDEFDYYTDETGEHLKHRRAWGDRGSRKLVFAVARTKDGGTYVEVMDAGQVEAVKKQGYSSSDSPWNGPFQDEMWRKSVIRRMAKRLPSSTDMESFGQDLDDDHHDAPTVVPAEEKPAVSSKLTEAVVGKVEPVAVAPVVVVEEAPVVSTDPELAIGVLDEVVEREYKQEDGSTLKRWAGRIGGVAYGTSDDGWGNLLKTAHSFKSKLYIRYVKKANAQGKFINEIVDIGGEKADESPI